MDEMHYRDKCLDEKGKVCVECGDGEEVVVHHIDGDRDNNDIDNLVPMCQSCHKSVHNSGPGFDQWSKQLPDRSIIDNSAVELRDFEMEILAVAKSEGRFTPMLIRERSDYSKIEVDQTLVRLAQYGHITKVTRGLYEYNVEGEDCHEAVLGARTAISNAINAMSMDNGQEAHHHAENALEILEQVDV